MNKYLKGFLNLLIMLWVGFVGFLLSLNVLATGFIGFPWLIMETDKVFLSTSNPPWLYHLVPGPLPIFFLLAMLTLSIFSMYKTIWLIKRVDSEKIFNAIVKKGKTDENNPQ